MTVIARMSCDDGMVMQLHAGAWRNYNDALRQRFGRDKVVTFRLKRTSRRHSNHCWTYSASGANSH